MQYPSQRPGSDHDEREDGWLIVSAILGAFAAGMVFGILIGCGQVGEWLS